VSFGALAGRTLLVTGASRGIGAAVARRGAGMGASVHMVARHLETLMMLSGELAAHSWAADVTDEAGLTRTLRAITDRLGGPPDVVVNAAGVFEMAPLTETSTELFDRAIGANLRGPFLVIRALLPAMLERGSGTIVSVGSVAGHRAFPANAAYSASKFGLRGLHDVLFEELRGTGVRATLVEPAATDTSVWEPVRASGRTDIPERRAMLAVDDVAEAVLFAATRPDGVRIPLLRIERG
jgi:NADP-dependent 3-hydroxy acid dehydrogenase YdfG